VQTLQDRDVRCLAPCQQRARATEKPIQNPGKRSEFDETCHRHKKASVRSRDWRAFKKKHPTVEKIRGFKTNFGPLMDTYDALGEKTLAKERQVKQVVDELVKHLEAEVEHEKEVKKAGLENQQAVIAAQGQSGGSILNDWHTFVKGASGLAQIDRYIADLNRNSERLQHLDLSKD
jgi:hypothetical protein